MTWPTIALGALVAKKSPSVDPRRFPAEVFELFSVPAHDRGEPDIVAAEAIGSSKISVEPGDVLLCRIVPHIRRSWVVPEKRAHRQIASGEWMVFRDERFDPKFLRHFLVSERFHREFMTTVAGVGGSLLRARPAYAAAIRVPFPPLPEQRRIASILDEASRAIELDAQAAEARRGVVSAALESALRVHSPNYVELATLCTRITDGTHQSPSFTTSGVPFLFISNIIGGSVNYETAKFVSQETFEELTRVVRAEPGDILYSAVGSYGVPARVESDRPVVFQRHIAHIKPDSRRVNSVYLREVMASPVVKHQADRVARGGAQKTVTLGDLAKFKIPLVNESAQATIEQFAYASAKVNSLAKRRRASLTELQAALSGRLFNATQNRAEGELWTRTTTP